MLDFQKLIPQILQVKTDSLSENNEESSRILLAAQSSFEQAGLAEEKLKEILLKNGGASFWPLSIHLEPFGLAHKVFKHKKSHAIVACDGSQIMPSQHEIYSCYLLNIGSVLLDYSSEISKAELSSTPYLFHKAEDLFALINKRRVHVDESIVSLERGLLELSSVLRMGLDELQRGVNTLALVDGSLIPWNIDKLPDSFQEEYVQRYENIFAQFKQNELPLVGVLSHSRSSDVVNNLRVWSCPYPESKCQLYCGSINEEDYPCSNIWPLSDRQLLASKLDFNERSSFFLSSSYLASKLSSENRICFAYLNTGSEASRIELPKWLFDNKRLLEFSLEALLLQFERGHGYPVSLTEAHHQAVISKQDRVLFYRFLEQQLMQGSKQSVSISPKESRKRRAII